MATHQSISICFVFFLIALMLSQSLGDISCDFQQDFCNYTQSGEIDWIRNNGNTSTGDTGPDVDHTSGTSWGFYSYAEASSPNRPGDNALLISPVDDARQPKCVQFYYSMYGDQMGSLRVYVRNSDTTDLGDPVWELSGERGRNWYRGLASIPKQTRPVQMVFEAVIGPGKRSDIAIDDIKQLSSIGPCPVDYVNCTFESGWCDFVQDKTDKFDFTRTRGSTSSIDTGPSFDHTTNTINGFYVYIETSTSTNTVARIISPKFRGIQGDDKETFCVVFFYHMYGQTVNQLNVYLRNDSSTSNGNPIWSLAGTRGDVWRGAEAEINTPEDFNVIFEAWRGTSFTGDIALDDILITSYGCPGHHIVNNVSSVSCDFEEMEICYYTQDSTDDFDWTWMNRGTPDSNTGPDKDHSRGDEIGFFMLVSSSSLLDTTDKARLISPAFSAVSPKSCIELWYHMWGRDVATLNIYILDDKDDFTNPKKTVTGNQGYYWHRMTLDVNALAGKYRLAVEGFPGKSSRDDIAIDDIKLYSGQDCPTFTTDVPPSTTVPPPTENIDCDFEADFCNYQQDSMTDFGDWTRYKGKGGINTYPTGPTTDHTLGNALGYYMSYDPYDHIGALLGDNAILETPLITAKSTVRCLTFYAYMYGLYVDYLSVYIRPLGTTRTLDPQMALFGDHGQQWLKVNMVIPASSKHFQILFEALTGTSRYYSEISIDDVKLVDGECEMPQSSTQAPEPWSADCDFETKGNCGYVNYAYNYNDWVRNSGSTATDNTGPSTDHTLGTSEGHYMYIDASFPTRPNQYGILQSPILNSQNKDMCIRFYYHAFGKDIGSLTVNLDFILVNSNPALLSISGDQGDRWQPANLNIPAVMTGIYDFQVEFESRKLSAGFEGDVAIDDIIFIPRPCEGYPTESGCSFEQGPQFCNYYNGENADYMWEWYDELATEQSPLPNTVSTSFMYASPSTSGSGRTAVLYSLVHNLHGVAHCLTARLVLAADSSQQFKVEVEDDTADKTRYLLGTASGDWGSEWFSGNWSVPADLTTNPVRLVFTATSGSKSDGIVALDNVMLSTQLGSCAEFLAPPVTSNPLSTTTSGDVSAKPQTGGSNTGMIVGVTFAVIIVIVLIVIGVIVLFRSNPSWSSKMSSFSIGYKTDKMDQVPFSGVVAGDGGGVVMTDPQVTISDSIKPT